MLSVEESAELFKQGFKDMAAEGRIWVEMPEVARRAMIHHEGYMRRRQAVNRVLGLVGIHRPDMPKKAPYHYRNVAASMAADFLEETGELEYKYLNGDGELYDPPQRDPLGPQLKLDYRDRRYHYIPAAVQLEPVTAHSNGQPAVRRMPSPAEPYVI